MTTPSIPADPAPGFDPIDPPGAKRALSRGINIFLLLFCMILPFSIAGANMALGILLMLTLGYAAAGGELDWSRLRDPAFYALLSYAAAALLTALTGVDRAVSLRFLPRDLHKVGTLGFLLPLLAARPSPQAFRPLGIAMAALSLIGIFQFIAPLVAGTFWIGLRAHGFVHPVTYGEMLCLAFLGGICFFNRPEAGTETKGFKRAIVTFLAISGVALVLNQTRGAILGVVAGFAAVAAIDRRLRNWALTFLASLAAVAIAWQILPTRDSVFTSSFGRLNLESLRRHLFDYRGVFWSVAWRAFRDHPWTGVGPGNYRTVYPLYYQGIIEGERVWGSAHNLYLHQMAERGLVGIAALAAVLYALTARAYRRARGNPNAWNLWAFGSVVAFLVMNVTEVAFQTELMATFLLFIWAWSEANAEAPAAPLPELLKPMAAEI